MFLEREGLKGRARALIPADPKIYGNGPVGTACLSLA